MDEQAIQDWLEEVLEFEDVHGLDEDYGIFLKHVRSFEDSGILTTQKGLVLTLKDGTKFQLAINKV